MLDSFNVVARVGVLVRDGGAREYEENLLGQKLHLARPNSDGILPQDL
jgi:hypothetical protein